MLGFADFTVNRGKQHHRNWLKKLKLSKDFYQMQRTESNGTNLRKLYKQDKK